uniref:Uncharacterized protein n=1 Tax=Proboscia inermis TaxID=420281 RepID=A0A6T8MT91_9STRA
MSHLAPTDDNISIATLMKETYIPKRVKTSTTVVKASSSRTERTQTFILYLLTTICSTPQGLAPQITVVLTHVASLLSGSGSNSSSSSRSNSTKKELKLEALGLFRTVLTGPNHNPATRRECLSQTFLIELTCRHALQEDWYKLIAEALRCLAAHLRYRGDGNFLTLRHGGRCTRSYPR